jgi:r-opsin
MYGSIWVIPPLFGWNHFIFEGFGTSCTFDYTSKSVWGRLYILMLVIGGFFIPLLIIVICYIFILIELSKRSRHFLYQNSNNQRHGLQSRQLHIDYFHPTNSLNDERSRSEVNIEANENNQIVQNFRRTEIRATRTALLVCAIYCIAWGPYALMAILSNFDFNYFTNAYTTAMLGLFTKTAACINPLLYALSSSGFRRQICTSVNFLYPFRESSHLLSSSTYDLNRRSIMIKINQPVTSSDLSHQ